jgi:hypothetical protein
MAFVAQNMPNLATNGAVIPPIAPLAPDALASPGGFQRFEGLTTDEGTVPDSSKEQNQISRQVGQFAIASLIELPTSLNVLVVARTCSRKVGAIATPSFKPAVTQAGRVISIFSLRHCHLPASSGKRKSKEALPEEGSRAKR